MNLPSDYAERVYAGVLGKIIGVYLGRPFEGWTYQRIMQELGEIDYYVNDRLDSKPPLVITDDDITGTFTFLRSLPDYDNSINLTPAQIGQTWLNYIIENETILWWGGFGNSTEHTVYLRLKNGIQAPESGSIALNGKIIAEQIGAQIFIDGWAMIAPGNPDLAVDFARRAASVSHDGEAIYAAQVLAAMEAQAFVEADIQKLLDVGISYIPENSVIYRMIADIRAIHAVEPDWHQGFAKMARHYNYENYGGNCHMVPNHGLIILGLLYGDSDFTHSMRVINTAGWDTDCNAGNLGCLLGIKDGLATFHQGTDWRGPIADRLYMPAADGGRSISDAVIETQKIVAIGYTLARKEPPNPKNGARFHFEYPGSVQGFQVEGTGTQIENVTGFSQTGNRALKISYTGSGRISTPTFILPTELDMPGYKLLASPSLYAGQTVHAALTTEHPTTINAFIKVYNSADQLTIIPGPDVKLTPNTPAELEWTIPDTHSQPIAEIGFEFGEAAGNFYLDYLTWVGEPDIVLTRPVGTNSAGEASVVWRRAWVAAMDQWEQWWPQPYRLIQNSGRGLLMQGTREWQNYEVSADILPWLVNAGGIAARVQGLQRFYTLQLVSGKKIRLLKALDGDQILAEKDFAWKVYETYQLKLQVAGNQLRAWVNDELHFEFTDYDQPLTSGGVAYVVDQGHISSQAMKIQPFIRNDATQPTS